MYRGLYPVQLVHPVSFLRGRVAEPDAQGMISYDTGSKIEWDAPSETIPGNAAANKLLKRQHRAPWEHPYRQS